MQRQRILALGYHDQSSPRHLSVLSVLKAEGYDVIECHTAARGFLPKCRDLLRQYRSIAQKTDTVLVPFPGHYLMPLAWLLTRFPRKCLFFDAFLSLHDTMVDDRKIVSRRSPRAWLLWIIDYLSLHLADQVFIDTEAHRQFFIKRFHLNPDRIRVIYLHTRTDLFTPIASSSSNEQSFDELRTGSATSNVFEVFFYGSYIPLQGIEYILHAAKILQDGNRNVHFTLVGSGQTYPAMQAIAKKEELTNVTFLPFLPLSDLPPLIQKADLCLGIFGTSGKAQRVIPHKVYDAVACGVPVLTADSPAIREKFANHPLVLLCPPGDPEAIANVIRSKISSKSATPFPSLIANR